MARDIDFDLIKEAKELASRCYDGKNHHVAAAARAPDGRTVVGMSVSHFLGGPCAEVVIIGSAAAQRIYELTTMVVVGLAGRVLIPPCGRCRQALFDYFPSMDILIGDPPAVIPIAELLPLPYRRWLTDPRGVSSMGGNHEDPFAGR
ncbi:cytidine deaminase family protein [Nonomuraea rhodomycinica]|uniref:cytidine deaminase family protein n=1 Tax=Nonomuraea rhodomycinica TaxID=1712872 RepID=UPI001C37B214|nr:hypothetical protein [Nonomuraea rhodomycinica]